MSRTFIQKSIKETLIYSIPLMVRCFGSAQHHHERNQKLSVRPEPFDFAQESLVEGLNQRFLNYFITLLFASLLAACGGGTTPTSTTSTPPAPHLMGGAIQGVALSLATPAVSTFAGTASDFVNATGAAARFKGPQDSVVVGDSLYVADTDNNAIRKVVIATGEVTTLAGTGLSGAADGAGASATFNNPTGITSTGGSLYVADRSNHKIREIVIATGVVSSVTGVANTPSVQGAGQGATDGAAATATFNYPSTITTDGTNLYAVDGNNHTVRVIEIATGAVSTLAGQAGVTGAADGIGAAATFFDPWGITTDGTNLYVADRSNHKIRKIVIASGEVSSFTGVSNTPVVAGAADGRAVLASFDFPEGITNDGTNLYVTERNNQKIRKVIMNGRLRCVVCPGDTSSVTGVTDTPSTAGANDGAAATATFYTPTGISNDGTNLYVADRLNHKIRKIVIASGDVSSLAGTHRGADGVGAAASFVQPGGITSDGTNLYVTDSVQMTIRKIVIASGAVTTLAGQAGVVGAADGIGTAATFDSPGGITTDGTNLYLIDQVNQKIRKIVIATGVVSSFTGAANTPSARSAVDGAAAGATFDYPGGITTDGTNLYVSDTNNQKIRKIVIATGEVSSLTGAANLASVVGVVDGAGANASFYAPVGITTDGTNLYVADTYNHKIRKIVIATGVVSSVTGAANTPGVAGAADGAAASATFDAPYHLTSDGINLYVGDSNNQKIRKVVIATGAVSSLTGAADTPSVQGAAPADGAAATATFNTLYGGLTTDGSSLYVSDYGTGNNTIRKIQ